MDLALLLALILVTINFIAVGILDHEGKHLFLPNRQDAFKIVDKPLFPYFISFAGGLTLTYLFVDLFPRITQIAEKESPLILLLVVAGFFFFHLTEKYLYKHLPRDKFKKEYRVFHLSLLSIYKFAEGIVLLELALISDLEAILFFIPLLFISLNEDFSLHNWHGRGERPLKIFASLSVLFGVFLAQSIYLPELFDDLIIAFVTGALFYLTIINLAPKEKGGRLYALLAGVSAYILIFLFSSSSGFLR